MFVMAGEADELQRLMDRLDFAGSGVDGRIGGAEYFIADGDIPADQRFESVEGGPRALDLRQQFQDHQTVGGTPLPLDTHLGGRKNTPGNIRIQGLYSR